MSNIDEIKALINDCRCVIQIQKSILIMRPTHPKIALNRAIQTEKHLTAYLHILESEKARELVTWTCCCHQLLVTESCPTCGDKCED